MADTAAFGFGDDEIRRLLRQADVARAAAKAWQVQPASMRVGPNVAKMVESARGPSLAIQFKAFDSIGLDLQRYLASVEKSRAAELSRLASQIGEVRDAEIRRIASQFAMPTLPPILAPDTTRALAQMMAALRLPTVVDAASWPDVRARIEDVSPDDAVLADIEESIQEDPAAEKAATEAAEALRCQDPRISREQARRAVILIAYLAAAGMVSAALILYPEAAQVVLTASGVGAMHLATLAGQMFDKVWPPQSVKQPDDPTAGAGNV